ncbi:phage integrase [Escherichia coli]|uniref:phage integrase n=1 Tax=Escherichia coli TaxID=562 RepID=UPI000BF77FA4|nr:tyrosine-type recombinase/integrase [Escherichia coli]EFN8405103.1 integrase [Escherichia coli O15]PGG58423.1 integrase [Escherichia coli]HAN4575079.1 tyrosine-type recombinase/integrase [Escherichia coli]HAO9372755.1 tyrosine-type recombinase/integrase [Escherichia coli]HAW9384228.1 tyrosine-type recombinase/integrase [Escherichia coli]
MSIKQLKDGRYQVDVRPQGAGGRRIRKIFTLKSKAQEFERYVLQNFHNNPWQARPADQRRLSELIEVWWMLDGRNQAYGDTYRTRLEKVIREMGDPSASQMTRKFVIEYRSDKLQAGLMPSSINRDLCALSAMFSLLIDAEVYHNENPVRGIRKLKVQNTEMAFLSDDEIDRLLKRLEGDARRIAILCLSTGARWKEASTLRGEHIVGNRVTFFNTKNGKSRSVPVADSVVPLIKTRRTGLLYQVDYLSFREILQEVKPDLPKGQATHVMRHTFATHFMMNGGNIVTLQRILGHATIQQTMTYAHFSPDFLQDAISFNPLAESVHKLSIDQ